MDSFVRVQPVWLVRSENAPDGKFQQLLPPPLDRFIKSMSVRTAVAILEKQNKPPLILIEGKPDKDAQHILTEIKNVAPDVPVFLLSQWNTAGDMRSWSAHNVMQMVQEDERSKNLDRTNVYKLSERELQILQLMVKGLIKKEIAEQLSISYYTVDNHERNIFRKMNVHTRSAAVAKALIERIC